MIPFIALPVKIVRLFTSNVAPAEIASGVCLGMFMGFIPLNGPAALVLAVLLFIFRVNRLAVLLALPVFKLFYVFGVVTLADFIGGVLLIKAAFLAPLWSVLTHFPVLALLDFNNTLITGGLVFSGALCIPVYLASRNGVVILREKYFDKIKNSKFTKWFLKVPLIGKIAGLFGSLKG